MNSIVSINKLSTFSFGIDMSHNPKTSHLSTMSIAFDMSSNKKWREMSRGLTYTFAAVLFVRRDFSSAAPRQLSSEVMLCEAILFHFLKHFTRNFQTHLYNINDDCHSNLCYWFPLAFFNIRPHPPKKPNRWRKTKKHQREKRMSMFLFQELLCHHINVEWLKTCGCLTGTTKR